jgi:hypothetical protein
MKQDSISSLSLLSSHLSFVIGLSSNQTQSQGPSGVFIMVFTGVHCHSLRSEQYFCLVPATYESIFLEHLNKLVVEPIDDILIFSMFEDIHIGPLALMLETC